MNRRLLPRLLPTVALLVVVACGGDGRPPPPRYDSGAFTPPDLAFDPGPPHPGADLGDFGFGPPPGDAAPPDLAPPPDLAEPPDLTLVPPPCAEVDRRCDQAFAYPAGNEKAVELRGDFRVDGWTKGEPLAKQGNLWKVTAAMPWNTRVQYKFLITDPNGMSRWVNDPSNPRTIDDGFGGKNSLLDPFTCKIWSCTKAPPPVGQCGTVPVDAYDWRDAVLYFVFVDRFLDGNPGNNRPVNAPGPANWKGGDWAGVTQRLKDGYFQALGVNALWLTVPVDNTDATGVGDDGMTYSAFHGYWPRDLTKPESRFGTLAELKTLVDTAHQNKIRVILDYAMNHVHKDAPVYQQHLNDGWFNPLNVNGGQCICGSNVCSWDGPAAKTCWFRDYLPDFNFNNAAARKFSVDNTLWWLKMTGADGLRLDAVKHLELQWLLDLRARLLTEIEPVSKQHVYLVGETFTGDRGLIKSFVDPCRMLDGQFDFPLRIELASKVLMRQGRMGDLAGFMDGNGGFYGNAVMSTFVGNHDVPRAIHFAQDQPLWNDPWAGGRERSWQNLPGLVGGTSAYERLATAMAVLMTSRGVPLIYYGDEVGLPGAGDPDNRRMMEWANYSPGQQLLLGRMKALGRVRAAHPALRRGTRKTLAVDDETWVYQMVDGNDLVYVAVNRSDQAKPVGGLPAGALTDELSGDKLVGPNVSVPPRSARVLR